MSIKIIALILILAGLILCVTSPGSKFWHRTLIAVVGFLSGLCIGVVFGAN